jgi:hypothetical protein
MSGYEKQDMVEYGHKDSASYNPETWTEEWKRTRKKVPGDDQAEAGKTEGVTENPEIRNPESGEEFTETVQADPEVPVSRKRRAKKVKG